MSSIKLKNYDQFLTEKKITYKRKYGEHEAKKMYQGGSVRNAVLEFFSKKGPKVTLRVLRNGLKRLSEQTGKKINSKWFVNNKDLIRKKMNENGKIYFEMTPKAKRMYRSLKINEDAFATLDNTTSMGDVIVPTRDEPGSGDIFNGKEFDINFITVEPEYADETHKLFNEYQIDNLVNWIDEYSFTFLTDDKDDIAFILHTLMNNDIAIKSPATEDLLKYL